MISMDAYLLIASGIWRIVSENVRTREASIVNMNTSALHTYTLMPHAFVLVVVCAIFSAPNEWSNERCAKKYTQPTALFGMALHDFLVVLRFSF